MLPIIARATAYSELKCVAQDALSFSTWLVNDASYEAWVPAIAHLTNIRGLLFNDAGASMLGVPHLAASLISSAPAFTGSDGTDAHCVADLNSYAQSLLAPLVARLGWGVNASDDFSPLTVLLRSRALSAASLFNLSSVVQTVTPPLRGLRVGIIQ